ncbi:MAG TPA: band-7 C-terminal domain-containing protein [Casimicrobiaceae bacterium]|nr:band-7 C-terminal domain-containing protein [Casimicrobiaceae bacterium]
MTQFGNLAKVNNTIILPANIADVAGLVASALSVVKTTAPARAGA